MSAIHIEKIKAPMTKLENMYVPSTVMHIPHSSRFIPNKIRQGILLSDQELDTELIAMTDSYTDQLFSMEPDIAISMVFPVSRLVVDPERFLDDDEEIMAKYGMGVIYTRTSNGQTLRNPPTKKERNNLIKRFYHPHHEQLEKAVGFCLQTWGWCLIIDCHSFPSRPLPYELDQNPKRPEICIGTDSFHTPYWLKDEAKQLFESGGFIVDINRPFSGSLVPFSHYGKTRSVISIMIELNRSLYMDESSGERCLNFSTEVHRIRGVLKSIIDKTKQIMSE
jgi:N-formylglutamate amidohydrolase